jgi:hypothetical protein
MMANDVGKGWARPSDQALAVPATPANAVDGPSGFDPSRIGELPERLFVRSLELMDAIPSEFFDAVQDGAGLLAEIRNQSEPAT